MNRPLTSGAPGATALLGMAVAAALSCSHGQQTGRSGDAGTGPLAVASEVRGDQLVRTFDLNRDGKPDDWKYFRLVPDPADATKTHEVLIRRELDTNFDGKPDITTVFNEDGTKASESFDLDFDGRQDVVDTYEKGVLVRKDTFHRQAKAPDQVAYYEGGKKVRVERDTRGTGKVDTWEYYENGKLSRIGEDLDGDGLVDRWIKSPDDEEAPPKPVKH